MYTIFSKKPYKITYRIKITPITEKKLALMTGYAMYRN